MHAIEHIPAAVPAIIEIQAKMYAIRAYRLPGDRGQQLGQQARLVARRDTDDHGDVLAQNPSPMLGASRPMRIGPACVRQADRIRLDQYQSFNGRAIVLSMR
ncbi:hypothetical protein [Sphingomonas parapaucimobilis]|uniref:hypothetical protein n=1 Tax=Sphingomonas parapaucimobilis TaxID=28213 RepID=UPI00391BEA26